MYVNALHVGLAVSGEDLENVLSLSPNAKDRVSHPTSLDDSMEVDLSFDIHSLLGSSSPGNSPSIHTCMHTYINSYIIHIHTCIHTYAANAKKDSTADGNNNILLAVQQQRDR